MENSQYCIYFQSERIKDQKEDNSRVSRTTRSRCFSSFLKINRFSMIADSATRPDIRRNVRL